MSFSAMFRKEAYDLVREKRFGVWALGLSLVWAFILVMTFVELSTEGGTAPHAISALNMAYGVFFTGAISLVVLSLFTGSDGVARDRESGTLPLVCATPVSRMHLLLAKLAVGGLTYLGALLVTLFSASLLAYLFGSAVLVLVLEVYAFPLLVLHVFLLGIGLLLGVVANSSKVAVGAATALYLPLFLAMREGPLEWMLRERPGILAILSYTPFTAVYDTFEVLLAGGTIPWGPLLVTLGLGIAAVVASFVVFARQEGAL